MLTDPQRTELQLLCRRIRQEDPYNRGWTPTGLRNWATGVQGLAELDDAEFSALQLARATTLHSESLPFYAQLEAREQTLVKNAVTRALRMNDFLKFRSRHAELCRDTQIHQMYIQYLKTDPDIQDLFHAELSPIICVEGEHDSEALAAFEDKWVNIIGKTPDVFIGHIRKADTLKDTLFYMRFFVYSLRQYQTYMRVAPASIHTFINQYNAVAINKIIDEVEKIRAHIYEDTDELTYSQNIAAASALLENEAFIGLAPGVLIKFLRDLKSIGAVYGRLEQHLNGHEYEAAAEVAQELVSTEGFKNLVPPRYHDYFEALASVYGVSRKLKAADAPTDLPARVEMIKTLLMQSCVHHIHDRFQAVGVADGSYVNMTEQLSLAAHHLDSLLKSTNLLEVSTSLKGLSAVISRSPMFSAYQERFKDLLVASTATEAALQAIESGDLALAIPQLQTLRGTTLLTSELPPVVSNLLVIIEEVETIREMIFSDGGTEATQALRYREGIDRLAVLKENRAFIEFAPQSLKEFVNHVQGFSKQYGEIEEHLNRKEYAEAARRARHLADEKNFKALCPERLLKYIDALAKSYDLHQRVQAINRRKEDGPADRLAAQRDEIHRFIHSVSFNRIYAALLTPSLEMPLSDLKVNLASIIEVIINLSQANTAESYLEHAARLTELLSKNPHLLVSKHDELSSASKACQHIVKAIEYFEEDKTTLGIEELNALVSNTAFKIYTPDFASSLLDLIHEFNGIRTDFFENEGPINYSALYARIDTLQSSHPSYKIIMPSSAQKIIKDIKKFIEQYQAIEDAINQKQYAYAAQLAHNLLSAPDFLKIIPDRFKKYLELVCGTYELTMASSVQESSADMPLSQKLSEYVHSTAFQAVYNGVFTVKAGTFGKIQADIVVMLEACTQIQKAQTPRVFCEQVAILIAHLKENPQLVTSAEMKGLLHDVEGIAALMSAGLIAIEDGDYTNALDQFKLLNAVPSFKSYVPPMVGHFIELLDEVNAIRDGFFNHEGDLNYAELLKRIERLETQSAYMILAPESIKKFIANLTGIAEDYKEIEQSLNDKSYSKAALQARLLADKASFRTLAPKRTHKYLSAFARSFDLGRTLLGAHDPADEAESATYVTASQAIQAYINSPCINALYALQFKEVTEEQFTQFQANTVRALHLFKDLMEQDDVHGFLNVAQTLVVLLRQNNAISPNKGIVKQLERFEGIIKVINTTLNDINEGRYSSAISSINKLNENAMFVDIAPQFMSSMLANLEALNKQYATVEAAVKSSNFREASQLASKLLDSNPYRRLMPKHLQQYSNALIKAEDAYSKIFDAARSANYKVAHDHLLTFINQEHDTDVYKTFAFMFGEEDFNEFKVKLTDRTYVITDLLRNLTNKSGSPVQGFIYWAHQHQQVLSEDFSMIAFIQESMDTPEARLLSNVRTLFAARGFPRQCPSYNDLSVSENFYLMGYIEEYIFERSQEAKASKKAPAARPESVAMRAVSGPEMTLADHVMNGSTAELSEFLYHFKSQGADAGHCLNMNALYDGGQTLLHLAASRGDMGIITILLNHAHIGHANWENEAHQTPIMVAAKKGNIDLLKLFTDASHRVAINHTSEKHQTVLDVVYADRSMQRVTRSALAAFLLSQGALCAEQIKPQGPTTQTFAFIRNIVLDALFYATHFVWRKVRLLGAFIHRCAARLLTCSWKSEGPEPEARDESFALDRFDATFKRNSEADVTSVAATTAYCPAQTAKTSATQDDLYLPDRQSKGFQRRRSSTSSL